MNCWNIDVSVNQSRKSRFDFDLTDFRNMSFCKRGEINHEIQFSPLQPYIINLLWKFAFPEYLSQLSSHKRMSQIGHLFDSAPQFQQTFEWSIRLWARSVYFPFALLGWVQNVKLPVISCKVALEEYSLHPPYNLEFSSGPNQRRFPAKRKNIRPQRLCFKFLKGGFSWKVLPPSLVHWFITSSNLTSHGTTWLRRTPITNGAGTSSSSFIFSGRIGTNVCCQLNGYNIDSRASTHSDSELKLLVDNRTLLNQR